MKKSSMKDRRLITISVLILWLIWFLVSRKINNDIYLPTLKNILIEIYNILFTKEVVYSITSSILRGLISVLIAILISVILGVISAFNKYIYNFLYPINLLIKSIPTIAFIVIALIWVDKSFAPFLIGFFISYPIFYDVIISSILNIDRELIEMCDTFKISFLSRIKNIYGPKIIFSLFNILSSTISLTLKVVIAGEVYGQPDYGIGTLIQMDKMNFNTVGIFAWIIIIVFITFIIDIILKIINKNFILYGEKDDF
ncbi:ABC transporter permease [Clostridium thermobutyricum]